MWPQPLGQTQKSEDAKHALAAPAGQASGKCGREKVKVWEVVDWWLQMWERLGKKTSGLRESSPAGLSPGGVGDTPQSRPDVKEALKLSKSAPLSLKVVLPATL